ncbi:MAG: glycyl-radical enzyme activating protein [Ruminococcaceae bacterium]|nr:glycyl-radical enzyme activating protein [Oscillospiraceae bacterium]
MKGCIFNIQRFSIHDGPGIRTNVFLKGCPLNCLWCHNPEGLDPKPQIKYSPEKCIGCAECLKVCEPKGHKVENGIHTLDFSRCIACMKCAENCPAGAVERDGEEKSVEEIIDTVLRDKSFYEKSGGGMTLSGGEPLYQGEFALGILKAAKQQGIHTAVETCGMTSSDIMKSVAPYVDLFLYDYKATGEEEHKRLTGASQRQILLNLNLLEKLNANVILRCPIIPGINDNEEHYRGIAEVANKHKNINEINIMPYHSLGNSKRKKLGLAVTYEAETMKQATAKIIKEAIEKYTEKEVKVV